MKRKRSNVAVIPGEPGQWALNNSVKNRAFRYVQNILNEPKRNEFEWYFRKRGRNYATMNTHGKLTGFAILGPDRPSGTVRLYLLGAKPGRGIGGVLMQQIENNARQRGLSKIRIMDPVFNAMGFYQHLGFVPGIGGTLTKRLSTRRSPSRPSPTPRASSSPASVRRSVNRRTPRRQTPRRN